MKKKISFFLPKLNIGSVENTIIYIVNLLVVRSFNIFKVTNCFKKIYCDLNISEKYPNLFVELYAK